MPQPQGPAINTASRNARPKSSVTPKNWPHGLPYLSSLIYTHNLDPHILNRPRADLSSSSSSSSPTNVVIQPSRLVAPVPHVRITPIAHPSHPANGQYGLYAAQHLAPGSLIVLYIGVAHLDGESDPSSDYDLCLDRERGVSVDAGRAGNEARFVNDYRGVRNEGPNAEFRDVWVEVGEGLVGKRIGVFVLGAGKSGKRAKGIAKGEEIVVSYGKGFWSERRKEVEGLHSEH